MPTGGDREIGIGEELQRGQIALTGASPEHAQRYDCNDGLQPCAFMASTQVLLGRWQSIRFGPLPQLKSARSRHPFDGTNAPFRPSLDPARDAQPFVPIVMKAGQGQIVARGCTVMLSCNDMINLKRKTVVRKRNLAILAPLSGPLPNFLPLKRNFDRAINFGYTCISD